MDVSGKEGAAKAAGEQLNEHVWYDFPTVKKVADRIEAALAEADPDDAGTFKGNNQAFQDELDALISQEADDKAAVAGAGIAVTEPVPLYLTEAVGAVNKTPAEFSEAIEEGVDVSPVVLQETLALFTDKQVNALVYNAQTAGPETERVLQAAKENAIDVVPVTETLPEGKGYVSWMQSNLDSPRQGPHLVSRGRRPPRPTVRCRLPCGASSDARTEGRARTRRRGRISPR